jgi:hypothetical protein
MNGQDSRINLNKSTVLSLLNYNLRYLITLIVSIPKQFLQSVIVIFVPENKYSGSADIARIDSISKAIIEKAG